MRPLTKHILVLSCAAATATAIFCLAACSGDANKDTAETPAMTHDPVTLEVTGKPGTYQWHNFVDGKCEYCEETTIFRQEQLKGEDVLTTPVPEEYRGAIESFEYRARSYYTEEVHADLLEEGQELWVTKKASGFLDSVKKAGSGILELAGHVTAHTAAMAADTVETAANTAAAGAQAAASSAAAAAQTYSDTPQGGYYAYPGAGQTAPSQQTASTQAGPSQAGPSQAGPTQAGTQQPQWGAYTWNAQGAPYYSPYQQHHQPPKPKKKRGAKFGLKLLAAVLACCVVSLGSVGVFAALIQTGIVDVESPDDPNTTAAFTIYKQVENSEDSTPTVTQEGLTAQEIAQKLIPSVVCIQNYQILIFLAQLYQGVSIALSCSDFLYF